VDACSPVPYGYVVLACATASKALKSFGQNNTLFVSVPGLLADCNLTRTQLGTLFSAACLAAAVVQPWLGRAFDRFGCRVCIPLALVALALSLIGLAASTSHTAIFLALFGLRAIGLGALETYSAGTVSLWFCRHRGVALAVLNVGWALGGFWACVRLLTQVSRAAGWRAALSVAAAVCAASAPLVAFLLRRSPEAVGAMPDCDVAPPPPMPGDAAPPAAAPEAESATRAEALQSAIFWGWALYTWAYFFGASGTDFHLIEILKQSGDVQPAGTLSLSNGGAAAAGCLVVGLGMDRIGLRGDHLMSFAGAALALYFYLLAHCNSDAVAYAAGTIKGLADAAAGVAVPYMHAKRFGRLHLGSIFAANRMAGVVGSGMGPLLIGAYADRAAADFRASLRAMSLCMLLVTAATQAVYAREQAQLVAAAPSAAEVGVMGAEVELTPLLPFEYSAEG